MMCLMLKDAAVLCNLQRKGKKGRRMVAREIDFDGDNEVTPPSEDLLTSTSCTSELLFYNLLVVKG